MAGVASHFTPSIEILLVQGKHHLHHLAHGLLGLLVALIESAADMTEIAFHSQRSRDELHGRNQLPGVSSRSAVLMGIVTHPVMTVLLASRMQSSRR